MSGWGSDLWDRGEVSLTIFFICHNDNFANFTADLGHNDDDLDLDLS